MNKKIIFISIFTFIGIILLIIFNQKSNAIAEGKNETSKSIKIKNDYDKIVPDDIVNCISKMLDNKPQGIMDGSNFGLTFFRQEKEWAVISIASILDEVTEESEFPFKETANVIAYKNSSKVWECELMGTEAYQTLYKKAPYELFEKSNKTMLDNQLLQTTTEDTAISYLIPWSHESWNYTAGWGHCGSSCWDGLDIGTSNSIKSVYAAAASAESSGAVICSDTAGSANVYITDKHGSLIRYTHLDKNTLGVTNGQIVETGQYLGDLKTGNFNYFPDDPDPTKRCIGCGCAQQNSNYGHLHFVTPVGSVFEGWEIKGDNTWKSGDNKNVGVGSLIFERAESITLKNQDFNLQYSISADKWIETGLGTTTNIKNPNGKIDIEGGTYIKLNPGFTAENGSHIRLHIRDK